MKRLALLSSVIAVAVLALFATTAAQSGGCGSDPETGLMYDMWGYQPEGVLCVANAGGEFIEVQAVNGELVWAGLVPADYFEVGCPNRGIGAEGEILHVWTSSGQHFCIDRDEDWIWE